MMAARLITAVLAPLRIERVELDDRRRAPQPFGDALQLVVAQRDIGGSGKLINQATPPAESAAAAATRRRGARSFARWLALTAYARKAPYPRGPAAWRSRSRFVRHRCVRQGRGLK